MGIGEAIALALAKEGANLILISRSEVRENFLPRTFPWFSVLTTAAGQTARGAGEDQRTSVERTDLGPGR